MSLTGLCLPVKRSPQRVGTLLLSAAPRYMETFKNALGDSLLLIDPLILTALH